MDNLFLDKPKLTLTSWEYVQRSSRYHFKLSNPNSINYKKAGQIFLFSPSCKKNYFIFWCGSSVGYPHFTPPPPSKSIDALSLYLSSNISFRSNNNNYYKQNISCGLLLFLRDTLYWYLLFIIFEDSF